MAKKAYIGVDGVARKVKKGYVGVDGTARKIRKAYIGIGDVARPCWAGGELAYYGVITPLTEGGTMLKSASVGNYALFGGGRTHLSNEYKSTVDAYDKSLTKSNPTPLTRAYHSPSAESIGNYAIFAGNYYSQSVYAYAEAYNASLVRSVPASLSLARHQMATAIVGDYALFAGGMGYSDESSDPQYSTVDAYNSSLGRTVATSLTYKSSDYSGVSVDGHAIFSKGGSTTNIYNTSLTRSIGAALSNRLGSRGETAKAGEYGIFPSGQGSTVVDAFDSSLTKITLPSFSVARRMVAATSVEGFAIFGCGIDSGSAKRNEVDAYDESLTKVATPNFKYSRSFVTAATVGSYALFGGGLATDSRENIMEAFAVL